ncbi:Beta-barrel assembly machine subunit BamA [Arboricoccus pini]|uniref:Outer membrane protein assembly factor BamA n=1 Tax=Arboricoccus pini TaxID=1963835 RepID=A0A212R751_9PROT|nr:outer membrane protein assembly factor BamA [Arboricoccus pini]SNB67982.1 Beta-barrel assembly machine subunit BamA [Arboricoccus pini]
MRALISRLMMATLIPFVLTVSAMAQTSGGTIANIAVQGNQRVEQSTVESYLAVHRGDNFDPTALDQSLKNLYATGLFKDVSISQDGSTLTVHVVENPIINRIAFEGNKRIEDKTLESEIQLRPRVVFSEARVRDAVQRILDLYRRQGRYAARVEPKTIDLDQNRVDLVFEIDEGEMTRVAAISFVGNKDFSANTLRGVISTKESAWYRFFSSNDNYDPDRLNFDQEMLRRFYLARGYADFTVVSAIAELGQDGKDFYITFTVQEGQRYKFGAIDLTSSVPDVPVDELKSLITTKEGKTYNADEVEATVQSITDRLGQLGYAFVQVDPQTTQDRDNLTIGINYGVKEGPRVYVEKINITGNVRTLDEVIRREFRLAEGDPFNSALLRRSQQRVRNLDFFDSVNVTTAPGSAPDRIIINVAVTEKSTGELSFGAGFSTSDGPLGDIRLSERNLLGTGRELSANFTVSGRRQLIQLSYTEPYFLNKEIAAGFDVYRSQTNYQSEANFDENRTGITLRATYPLTEYLKHTVRYTLRLDEIKNVDDDASRYIKREEGQRLTSGPGQSFAYDRRDTVFLPSSGYYFRVDEDVAGVGGDNRWLRHEGRADWYYSIVPDVVLNLGASAGYIFGLGSDVHLTDRFFIGGQTFRGFDYAGMGPRDKDTDDALGGNAYWVGTTEVRFPLGLPDELRIFGRAFSDFGTLTKTDLHGGGIEDSGNIRVSTGVGLSWVSPLGPLAIDIAQPVVKDSGDKTEIFRLSFGTRF